MIEKLKELLILNWGITAEEAQAAARLFEFQELPKGSYHTKVGDRHPNLSIVMDGYLRVYAIAENKEATQWISSPSELITDLSGFVFHQPARWNIQCLTKVSVFTISQLQYKSLSELINNWAEIEKRFISSCFIHIENRVFSFISQTASQRYRFLFEHNRALINQVPLTYLASMLGMSPETLSRVRSKLKDFD